MGKYVSSSILAVIRVYPKSYGTIRRDGSTAHSAAEPRFKSRISYIEINEFQTQVSAAS